MKIELDNSIIHQGDCVEFMSMLPDTFINLTVTSPSYDNLRNYNKTLNWNWEIFQQVAKELYRTTKDNGVVVWVVGDATDKGSETGSSFRQALYFMECGFKLHDTMIYHKDNPPPVGGNNRYYQSFEYMFVFSKGTPKLNPIVVPRRNKWNDKRTVRTRGVTRDCDGNFTKKIVHVNTEVKKQNVWTYKVGGGISSADKIAFKHPAIFPEKLAEDHISSWSNENDVVFDPFMGSATTGKMAKQLKRRFIGCEVVPDYIEIAKSRLGKPYTLTSIVNNILKFEVKNNDA